MIKLVDSNKKCSRRSKVVKVSFNDEIRELYNCFEVNGVLIRNVHRIIRKHNLVIFQNKLGKEIARIVLYNNEWLEFNQEFDKYTVCA